MFKGGNMIAEPVTEQNDSNEKTVSFPFPDAHWGRWIYGLFIIILPVFAFWGINLGKPEWQSGNLTDYIKLLLSPEASLLFMPLLVYSITSYILLLISPAHYASSFLIRMGIYSGVMLALQYSILTFLALEMPFVLIVAGISPLIVFRFYPWMKKKWNLKFLRILILVLFIGWYIVAAIRSEAALIPLFLVAVLLAMVSPFWCLLLSLRAAIWLYRNFETGFTVLRGFGSASWVAIFVAAWRFDILKMSELYAALPTSPPCYIATAAAQGHPHIVRSQPVRLKNGNIMRVNPQLQHFKAVEIAVMAVFPKLHQLIRKIYDVIGKKLAGYIRNPLLADVAFLLLLPVEWISFLTLKLFVPEIEIISKKIYHSSFTGDNSG
ncbi:MAG: DUF6688 family protein [Ferruginibacter sp.]